MSPKHKLTVCYPQKLQKMNNFKTKWWFLVIFPFKLCFSRLALLQRDQLSTEPNVLFLNCKTVQTKRIVLEKEESGCRGFIAIGHQETVHAGTVVCIPSVLSTHFTIAGHLHYLYITTQALRTQLKYHRSDSNPGSDYIAIFLTLISSLYGQHLKIQNVQSVEIL